MSEEQTEAEQVEQVAFASPEVVNAPAVAIRGQQAVGVPNIITQTGLTDPDKVEMLYDPLAQQVQTDELITDEGKFLDTSEQRARVSDPNLITGIPDVTVQAQDAAQIQNIERTFSNMPTAVAATGTITENDVVDPNQVVDERTKQQMLERGSLAEAQTQTLANEASIAYQIQKLTQGMETGQFPPWASPTVRKVNEIMQQRGLGSSSMAAAALAQGLIESTVPIAAQEAQANATLQLQNLNNQQQTALSNAATIAAMDRQNLDNRMKAAQQNAQSFLNMNLKNTTNEQQSAVLTYQSKVQSLFTDQAAANAAQQFNATSQNQVNQFYDQLGATVEQANAARDLAIQKFNSEETSAVKEFNTTLDNAREQFNVSMRTQIDQSNALWRRQTNTANNVNQNRANQINAGILLGLTTAAQNDLWQKYRDDTHQAYASSENEIQRAHQMVITAMRNQFNVDAFNRSVDFRKQVQAGAIAQRNIDTAVNFGIGVLTSRGRDGQGQSIVDIGVESFLGLFDGSDDDPSSGQFLQDQIDAGEFDLLDGDSFFFTDDTGTEQFFE